MDTIYLDVGCHAIYKYGSSLLMILYHAFNCLFQPPSASEVISVAPELGLVCIRYVEVPTGLCVLFIILFLQKCFWSGLVSPSPVLSWNDAVVHAQSFSKGMPVWYQIIGSICFQLSLLKPKHVGLEPLNKVHKKSVQCLSTKNFSQKIFFCFNPCILMLISWLINCVIQTDLSSSFLRVTANSRPVYATFSCSLYLQSQMSQMQTTNLEALGRVVICLHQRLN